MDDLPLKDLGCICFNLRKTSRAVSQAYDAFLQPSGLRTTQYSLLSQLAAGGCLTSALVRQTGVVEEWKVPGSS